MLVPQRLGLVATLLQTDGNPSSSCSDKDTLPRPRPQDPVELSSRRAGIVSFGSHNELGKQSTLQALSKVWQDVRLLAGTHFALR